MKKVFAILKLAFLVGVASVLVLSFALLERLKSLTGKGSSAQADTGSTTTTTGSTTTTNSSGSGSGSGDST